MSLVICNTSPFQYLHQLGYLHLIPALVGKLLVPPAVVDELNVGRSLGLDLPDLKNLDWVSVQSPISAKALPLVWDLGKGETEVLMLALEISESKVILDDLLARRVAQFLQIPLTGTLGILLDAKQSGLVENIQPLLDKLQQLRFKLSKQTYEAVLKLANEG